MLRYMVVILALTVCVSQTNGQFERMFQEATILDKPAGTGKILIQSELKIETLHMPDVCKVQAKKGDTGVFDFDVWINDNETKFETSQDTEEGPGEKMVIVVGQGMVIPGIEAGILNICIGEKRRLKIPPHLAWGEKGVPDLIPENAYVTFEVELLEIVPKSWGQWYIEMVQMACTVSFVIGVFVMLVQQVRERRKQQRKAARRERKRLKLREQCAETEDEEEEDEEEYDENEDDDDENNGEENGDDENNKKDETGSTEWTDYHPHAKQE